MDRQPKFSIITITFNAASVIEPTLQSVLSQTYTNYEYLLIDGGSTDDTVAKAKASGIEFAHIVSERDNGLYDAMNKGIALATGDYLCFLNAGDAFYARRDIAPMYDLKYRLSSDVDWCIKVMKKSSKLVNVNAVVVNYLQNGLSLQRHRESLKERFWIMSKHYGLLPTIARHLWFVVRAVIKK